MAASRDAGGQGLDVGGRRHAVLVAGHQQRRNIERLHGGGLRAGQRLATLRIAFRRLPHHAFAHQRQHRGLVLFGPGAGCALDDGVRDFLHRRVAAACQLRTRADAGAPGIGRRGERPEQRERLHPAGMRHGVVLGHDGAKRMRGDVQGIDFQLRQHPGQRADVRFDGQRACRQRRPRAARQIRPDDAEAFKGAHHRCPGVGRAAQAVYAQQRRPLAVDFHGQAVDVTGAHDCSLTKVFSIAPRPSISTRTTSPAAR
ncbi:hypothetical protein FQZ97_591070 [compost metagenome]